MQLQERKSTEVAMSGGSSSGKCFGRGKEEGRVLPLCGRGLLVQTSLGRLYMSSHFPVENKSNFCKDNPLRGYDNRKEEWPKCLHSEDCIVQMMTEGTDGGRRFFKFPRAWVLAITLRLQHICLLFSKSYRGFFVSVFGGSGRLWVR